MSEPTYSTEKDGAIAITVDGKHIRYVKESDLLAVKGASETTRSESEKTIAAARAELDEHKRKSDEAHAKLLQEQARREQMEQSLRETDALKVKAGELETKYSAAETSRKSLEDELTGIKRTTFVEKYKVDSEKVNGMTLDQLREAEKHLSLVGFNPASKPANYDGGNGGTPAAGQKVTPLEQARNEIKISRELATKKARGE